jgi:hypothetical protein
MFSDEVIYQLDFVKKSKIIQVLGNVESPEFEYRLTHLKSIIESSSNDKISLVNYHECFSNKEYIDELVDLIDFYKNKEIYISATTSSKFKYFFNPLVNISFWRDTNIRKKISWKADKNQVPLFSESYYDNIIKENKGILSTRKRTKLRDYLFSVVDKNKFDGIIRYANWPLTDNEDGYLKFENKFPNFFELIDEYKKSFVSFITETELSDFMNPLTEKTLNSMLTKTMPVILGGRGFVKELENMGLYIFNKNFGFTDKDDNLESFDVNKADSFNSCIQNYNQMSKSDIDDMYNLNKDKIEHNFKIVSNLLFENKTII